MKPGQGGRVGWPSWVLLAVFLVVGWAFACSDRFLNDEGLLTHLFASLTHRAFAAAFFLQKTRPPLSALYAPMASLGVQPFLVAHVVVAGVGVLALASTAAALGHRRPWIPAAVLACSPLYLGAAAAGVSNTDAVAGLAVAGWLWSRGRPTATAVLLGTLVFVRAELAVAVGLYAGAMLKERRWAAVLGLGAFGIAYGLAGAIYHGDLLWVLHFPPALPEPMPDNPHWQTHSGRPELATVLGALLAISPALPLCALICVRELSDWERLGAAFVVCFATALLVLPQWRVFNFDLAPRYLLPMLPFAALLIGRATEAFFLTGAPKRSGVGTAWLAVLAILAFTASRQGAHASALVAVGVISSAVALAWARFPGAGQVVVLGLVAVGPVAFDDGAKIDREAMAPHLGELVDRLEELEVDEPRPVYTNEPLLAVYLRRTGTLPWAQVHYLVQADQRYELEALANPDNGQQDALWRALQHDFYGEPVRPGQLTPESAPADAIFALTKDERLPLVLPPEIWEERLRVLYPGYGTIVAELEPEAEAR